MKKKFIWTRIVFLFITPAIFHSMVSCGSESYTITEIVCSEDNSHPVQLAQDIHSIEVRDDAENFVDLAEDSFSVTQTAEVADSTSTNYDLFPSYSYLMQLAFSYTESGTVYDVTVVTNRFDGFDEVVFTINGEEQSVEYSYETVTESDYGSSYYTATASYTHQDQTRTLTVTWYGGSGSDYQYVTTIYSVAISCTLNCEDIVTFGLGDGSHKIECDYLCENGTQGGFESESAHSDYSFDTLEYFYEESEIQALATGCIYATHTLDAEMTSNFTVTVNAN